jgi:hypothetical protein
MTRYEERRHRKVEQLGEELMRIQMRGCYRQLTAEDEAEYNELLARYRRLSALLREGK